ncbi:MAG: YibE/F family protein [Firmicutes bacterium]|nr:YibE/F family protein [Bacillota bacterium]MBQ5437940.1 YibE/F family protein [Bacillota bacterium]
MEGEKVRTGSLKIGRQTAVWLLTVVISCILLFIGNRLAVKDLDVFNMEGAWAVKARVTEIGEFKQDSYTTDPSTTYENYVQIFYAKVLTRGEFRGEIVQAEQTSDNYTNMSQEQPVEVGDKVMLYNYGSSDNGSDWVFGGYARLDGVMWLVAAFIILLIVFGRIKGVNTIVSLGFTCLAVFAVFVPSVLAGWNIYLMTAVTCVYTIIMTLLITNGASVKSLTTILGCSFGVAVAAVISAIFDKVLKLTGILDEHSVYLQYLQSGVTIDLKGVIFAMIVIGAMGAVMDVAMDISTSLNEVHEHAPDIGFAGLFKSGMNIGRDVMGTMANTLVLAYIGSSLCSILIYITYSSSLLELLNRENIAVEMLQSITGSLAILLTIPLTTLVCCFMYTDSESLRFIGEDLRRGHKKKKKAAKAPAAASKPAAEKSIIPEKDPINFYTQEIKLK